MSNGIIGRVATVATTDATATVIDSIPLAEGYAIAIECIVIGIKSDASAAAGGLILRGVYRRASAGNVTLVGSVNVSVQEDSAGSPTCTLTANTTNQTVDITVTGIASETWNWRVISQFVKVSV